MVELWRNVETAGTEKKRNRQLKERQKAALLREEKSKLEAERERDSSGEAASVERASKKRGGQ